MKVSRRQVEQNRERMLVEAAKLFRQKGFSGVGVDEVADAAGLTHGNLYSQFGSKEALMSEAIGFGYACGAQKMAAVTNASHFVSSYLTAEHRDNPGNGCFMAALGGEVFRQGKAVRDTFTGIIRANMSRLSGLLTGKKREREDDALAIISTMVGALILARAVNDPKLSDRILSANRLRLLQRYDQKIA
jgi:TetR/AcrR family transcriptional regulator, transcriptional repressor for nem operon